MQAVLDPSGVTVPHRILVTGPGGFVGRVLVQHLLADGALQVVAAARHTTAQEDPRLSAFAVGDIGPATDWRAALERTDVVVHLAARVHVMQDHSSDPLAEFRYANVAATLALAKQAARAGVQRFVYISSIKVNGEFTLPGRPFRADDRPAPVDHYAISKHEAEIGLHQLAAETRMQVVVVRPPLVYGPGVSANFRNMMDWLQRGLPLPLGAVNNLRSLVGVDNLCDLISVCARHPNAAGQTFLASDGEDISTTDLLRRLGSAMGRPARLLPLPAVLLRAGLTALGRRSIGLRLCSSLQVDGGPTRSLLGWTPPLTLDEGLRRTALAYLGHTAHPTRAAH